MCHVGNVLKDMGISNGLIQQNCRSKNQKPNLVRVFKTKIRLESGRRRHPNFHFFPIFLSIAWVWERKTAALIYSGRILHNPQLAIAAAAAANIFKPTTEEWKSQCTKTQLAEQLRVYAVQRDVPTKYRMAQSIRLLCTIKELPTRYILHLCILCFLIHSFLHGPRAVTFLPSFQPKKNADIPNNTAESGFRKEVCSKMLMLSFFRNVRVRTYVCIRIRAIQLMPSARYVDSIQEKCCLFWVSLFEFLRFSDGHDPGRKIDCSNLKKNRIV